MKDGAFRNAYSGLVELNRIVLALGSVSIKLPGELSSLSGTAETEKACWRSKKNAGKSNMIFIDKCRYKFERVQVSFPHTFFENLCQTACMLLISLREFSKNYQGRAEQAVREYVEEFGG